MNYQIHPEAQAEVQAAAEHYERKQANLGYEFADEYDRALTAVLTDPAMYPRDENGPPEVEARHRTVRRFPFRIFYTLRDSGVYILAVAHTSRRPDYWHHRTTDATPETT